MPSLLHIAFSPDGRLFASTSGANTVQIWDFKTRTLQQALVGHSKKRVEAVEFSPNETVLASTSHDNTARLWDASTGVLQQRLKSYSYKVDE